MQIFGAQFHEFLKTSPQSITWSSPPRSVTLRKTPTGHLGLKIQPFHLQSPPGQESTTVIYKVQPDCMIQDCRVLAEFDRIVSVDGQLIVNHTKKEIYSLFESHKEDTITLGLCRVERLPVSSLRRLHSRTSSDSGTGSSPRSADTNGSFVYDYGLKDIPSVNSSLKSSCSSHTCSLEETIGGSRQAISIKRSASGSGSTCSTCSICSQACSQSGQRKRFSSKQHIVCAGQHGNQHVSRYGSCPVSLPQPSACTCAYTHYVNPSTGQCDLHCPLARSKKYTNGAISIPAGVTLSCVSELQLLESRDRARSLPLPYEVSTASNHSEQNCACNCWSNNTRTNLSDMAFEVVANKCTSKALHTNSKGACSDCLSIGQQILAHPQNVMWDPKTKVVNLERSNRKTLGFTFKARQCPNEDGSADLYTLVEQVTKGGPADGKLMVGDWIRSVDGNPLHDAKEELGFTKLLEKRESVRLVIQRPVDVKERNVITEKKGRKHCNYTPSTSIPAEVLPVPLDSATLCGVCNNSSQEKSFSTASTNVQTSNKPPKMERYFSTTSHGSNGSGRRHSPRTPPFCTCTNTISNSYLRSVSTVCEPSDWLSMAKNLSTVHENVKFPSLQLFIAGSHALKMAELLFSTCRKKHPLCFTGKEKFLHIRCYVSEEADGVTKLHLQDEVSVSENDLLNGVISQCLETQNSVCEEDIELDVATQFSPDPNSRCYSRLTSRSQNSNSCNGIVALDIFVVIDEKFFTHCCHVLFSKNSLFFLTFDGAKVLENTCEMAKIGQMVHSSRAASGVDTPLFLYGFLDRDSTENQSSKAVELETLFHTDHGRQILRYTNVVMPQFIVLQSVGGTVEDQGYRARQRIGQIVLHQEYLTGQLHLVTLSAMAWVSQQCHEGRYTLQFRELKDGIISMLPEIQECQLDKIIKELQASGTIRVCHDGLDSNGIPEEQLVLIKPTHLLLCLQALLSGLEIAAGNNRSSPRKNPGVKCPVAATKSMLRTCFETSDYPNMAANKLISILEDLMVVQKVWVAPDTYLLPYFCQELQSESESTEHKEEFVIYVELETIIMGTGLFFRFVNNLAQLCQATELSAISLHAANLTLEEWNIDILHLWKDDLLKITIRSTKVNVPSSPPRGFVNNLIQSCQNSLPNSTEFHINVPCPLGEKCLTDKGRQPHLIDILQDPIFCGNVRVDAKKCVKMWLATCSLKNQQTKVRSPGGGEPPEKPPNPKDKRFEWSTPVLRLPNSLLQNLFLQLRVEMPQFKDWTGFAGCIGKTLTEVGTYAIHKNPPQELITEWARANRATVRDLVNVLSDPSMERMDLVELIKEKML